MSFIVDGAIVVAVAAVGVAIYKHYEASTVKTTVTSAVSSLETLASKVSADAKADFSAVVAKLKAL